MQWYVGFKTLRLKSRCYDTDTVGSGSLELEKLEAWKRVSIESERYRELRTELVALFDGRVQSNKPSTDLKGLSSLEDMYSTMEQWAQSKKKGCQLTIYVFVEQKELVVTPASQRPPPLSQRRQTSTQMQLARAPGERQAMEEEGNFAYQVTARWTCGLGACKNYGKLCWVNGRDTPENHYPIPSQLLLTWADGIAKEVLTAAEPNASLVLRLQKHRDQQRVQGGSLKKRRRRSSSGSERKSIKQVFVFGDREKSYRKAFSSSPSKRHSPELISPQTEPLDLLDSFFEWCKQSPAWGASEEADINQMRAYFHDQRYDVESLHTVSDADWRDAGLKMGQKVRIMRCVKKWTLERTAAKHARREQGNIDDF